MRTTSFFAAALVAATAVAGHEDAARPRIYFPRHVKRQFSNVTTTSSSTTESQSRSADFSASRTRPRQEGEASPSTGGRVTTIIVSSTVYVQPPSSTGPASDTGSTSPADTDSSTSQDDDPTSSPQGVDPLPSSEPPSSDAPSSDAPSSDAPSSGGVPSTVVLPTTRSSSEDTTPSASEPANPVESQDPVSSEPPLAANTTSPSEPPVSVAPTTTSTTSGILLAPSGIVTTTTSAQDPLEPIESLISSVFNPPRPSNTTESPVSQAPVTTTTSVDTEPSIIPSLPVSDDPTPTVQPPVSSDEPTEPSSTPPTNPPDSTTVDPQRPSSQPPISEPSQGPSNPPISSEPPPITTTSEPPIPSGEPSVIPNPPISNVTSTLPPTSEPPVVTPTPSSTPPVVEPPVSINTTTTTNNTVPTAPTTIIPPTTSPTTTGSSSEDVTSVPPLSTISGSVGWATPTAILVDDASTTVSGIIAPTSGSGIPTTLPKAINPDTWDQPQPEDTTLIQIGFLNSLNYPFVSQNNQAAYQIFRLLPKALGYGSNFDLSKCRVMKLIPLDTRPSLGYLTTLAIASYPSNLVETLQMDIRLANSALYSNTDQIVQNLTMQINSAIDITLGSGYGGGPGWDTGLPPDPNANPADPFSSDDPASNQSSAEKGATAGIVAGSVGIAAAYGAAMFIIARRYKRKKQAHRRASSISNPSEMQQTGRGSPALMGGALLSRDFSTYGATSGAAAGERNSHGSGRSGMGNSGRTAYISAPVAAENSLGWN